MRNDFGPSTFSVKFSRHFLSASSRTVLQGDLIVDTYNYQYFYTPADEVKAYGIIHWVPGSLHVSDPDDVTFM